MADGNAIIPNAAARLQALKDELRCVICYNYFSHAVTLSCSHTFCLRCISSWLVVQLVCPTCREDIYAITPSESLDNMVVKLLNAINLQHLVPDNLGNANASHTECMRLLKELTAYVEAFSKYCMHEELDEIMLQHFHIVQGEHDEQEAELEAEEENEEYEEQAQEGYEAAGEEHEEGYEEEHEEGCEEYEEIHEGGCKEEYVEEYEEEHEEGYKEEYEREYEEEQEEEYEEKLDYIVEENYEEEDEEKNEEYYGIENMEYQDDDEHDGEAYSREWYYESHEYENGFEYHADQDSAYVYLYDI